MQTSTKNQTLAIVNILILPEFQGKGIGSQIIQDQIAEALKNNQEIKIGAFKINLRAQKLYEQLGFKIYDENDTHVLMDYHLK